MLFVEGKHHMIRVNEDFSNGNVTFTILKDTIKDIKGTKLVGEIEPSEYDQNALYHALKRAKEQRELIRERNEA